MSISKAIEQIPSENRRFSQNVTDHSCWHAVFTLYWTLFISFTSYYYKVLNCRNISLQLLQNLRDDVMVTDPYKAFVAFLCELSPHLHFTWFLCRLRSIATRRDHFVRRPSVCPSVCLFVCLSVCHTRRAMFRRRHMHSSSNIMVPYIALIVHINDPCCHALRSLFT